MTISLLHKYIDFDIRQLTTRYAELRITDPENRDLAQLGDSDNSDRQLIMRLIVTGVGKLKRALRDKLVNNSTDADDKLPKSEDESGSTTDRPVVTSWNFVFKDDEEDADGEALAELMHWFIVNWAVYEWCKMFSPADVSIAKSSAEDAEDELDEFLSGSSMPTKERRTIDSADAPAEVVYTYQP